MKEIQKRGQNDVEAIQKVPIVLTVQAAAVVTMTAQDVKIEKDDVVSPSLRNIVNLLIVVVQNVAVEVQVVNEKERRKVLLQSDATIRKRQSIKSLPK